MRAPQVAVLLNPLPRPRTTCGAFLVAFLGLLLADRSSLAVTELKVGSVSGSAGGAVLVPVTLSSDSPVIAAQFDLTVGSSALLADGAVAGNSPAKISVASRELSPGVRRVLIYTTDSQPLPSGMLLSIPISIAANALAGSATLTLSNVILSDPGFGPVAGPIVTSGSVSITAGTAAAEFKSAFFDAGGVLQLELSATGGGTYAIQTSSDLKAWALLTTQAAVNGSVRASDTNAIKLPYRFYRARSAP